MYYLMWLSRCISLVVPAEGSAVFAFIVCLSVFPHSLALFHINIKIEIDNANLPQRKNHTINSNIIQLLQVLIYNSYCYSSVAFLAGQICFYFTQMLIVFSLDRSGVKIYTVKSY